MREIGLKVLLKQGNQLAHFFSNSPVYHMFAILIKTVAEPCESFKVPEVQIQRNILENSKVGEKRTQVTQM